ncbi:hypothetical protein ILYODFUR_006417 [Ilyodon furcidens]|uniref:Uncharacterized protein n=1 Tax=Ilyodon furcidens TaxID=33524 RepID=A0ABV0UHY0_9TELE
MEVRSSNKQKLACRAKSDGTGQDDFSFRFGHSAAICQQSFNFCGFICLVMKRTARQPVTSWKWFLLFQYILSKALQDTVEREAAVALLMGTCCFFV